MYTIYFFNISNQSRFRFLFITFQHFTYNSFCKDLEESLFFGGNSIFTCFLSFQRGYVEFMIRQGIRGGVERGGNMSKEDLRIKSNRTSL